MENIWTFKAFIKPFEAPQRNLKFFSVRPGLGRQGLKEFQRGRRLWKFNKSLIKNENYREQIKTLIKTKIIIEDPQFRWEYFKHEVRKFSIHFSKDIMRNMKTERTY